MNIAALWIIVALFVTGWCIGRYTGPERLPSGCHYWSNGGVTCR